MEANKWSRQTKGIEMMKDKVGEAVSTIIHVIERDRPLLAVTFSNGFGLISTSVIDNNGVQLLIEYQTRVLLNLLICDGEISFYRYGLDDYYLNEEESLQLFKEMKGNLKKLIPYFHKE